MKYLTIGLLILFFFPIGLIQGTQSNIVYVRTDSEIAAFDVDSMTYSPIIEVSEAEAIIGRFVVTDDESEIYYVEYTNSGGKLFRYDAYSEITELIYEHEHLTQITPPSDGRMFLDLVNIANPVESSICLLMIESGNCDTIEIVLNFNSFYWMDGDTFITFDFHKVKIYQIQQTSESKVELVHATPSSESWYKSTTLFDDEILFITSGVSQEYKQMLQTFDTSTYEITPLPEIELTDIGAAISQTAVSLDGNYLAYTAALNLFVADLRTGETIMQLDGVGPMTWVSNEEIVFTTGTGEPYSYQLAVVNVLNESSLREFPVPTETQSVGFWE